MQQYYEEIFPKKDIEKKNKEKKQYPHNSKHGEEKQNFID